MIEDGVIRAENAHYYVDACDIDIRNNAYKVFRVYEKSVNNEKHKYTLVYFTYKDEFIEDLFIETAGIIEDDIALYLFPKDGESKLKRQLESLYREYTKDEWVNTLRMLGWKKNSLKKQLKVNMKMINRTSNHLNNTYKIILMSIVIFFILSSLICMFLFIFPYNTNYIYDNNISKVVEIRCSNDNENWGYATGFFISNDGEILTNKHVVKNGDSNYTYIQIRLGSESNWINAKILNNSDSSDLAMLKVNITGTNFF